MNKIIFVLFMVVSLQGCSFLMILRPHVKRLAENEYRIQPLPALGDEKEKNKERIFDLLHKKNLCPEGFEIKEERTYMQACSLLIFPGDCWAMSYTVDCH